MTGSLRRSLRDNVIPADTLFWQASQEHYDGVLAMYHDQGLGPLKLVDFETAVNITGGLPHLRISPDHGPAADFYLRDDYNFGSFSEAWRHAIRYLSQDPKSRQPPLSYPSPHARREYKPTR